MASRSTLPDLVSWNGGGFDLPVLHYRSLKAGVQAPRYWETGDEDTAFATTITSSRFHWRHLDLMDVLSGFQPRARAKLADVAALLGFPGKLGFSGDQVWDAYLAGELLAVRRYCETDVLNTYLIYLRFQFLRGRLDRPGLEAEFERAARAAARLGRAASRRISRRLGGRRLEPACRRRQCRERNRRGRGAEPRRRGHRPRGQDRALLPAHCPGRSCAFAARAAIASTMRRGSSRCSSPGAEQRAAALRSL